MTTMLTRTLMFLTLALPLVVPNTADAQAMTYDWALRGYNAMNQIKREVWFNNPNVGEAVRHAILIARNHGVYPPNFPQPEDIRVYDDPQGTSGCIWIDGEPQCSDWHTYQCRTGSEIDDLKSLKNGAWWYHWFYTSAALFAAPFNWPASVLLGGMAQTFALWEHQLGQRIEQYENNRCVNP